MSDPFDGFDEEIEEMEEISDGTAAAERPVRRDSSPVVRRAERRRPSKPRVISILHQDTDCFVIDKPAGIAEEHGVFDEQTAFEQLARLASTDASTLRSVFPMPTDASGIAVISRSPDIHARLVEQLADRRMSLRFVAIVRARVEGDSGIIDSPLLVPTGEGRVTIQREHGHGLPAVTEWRIVDRFVGFALLECRPRTVVSHQIRTHLQSAGMPLAVDTIYGGGDRLMLSSFKAGYRRSRRRDELPLIQRLSLHAISVAFEGPNEGRILEFSTPYPKDIRATIHQLQRFGRIPKS